MDEKKIVIISDDSNVIKFDDITIKHDSVDRTEVAEIKQEISNLEVQKTTIDERLVDLKAKLLYAEKVIAIADAEKAKAEQEASVSVENNEEIQESECDIEEA